MHMYYTCTEVNACMSVSQSSTDSLRLWHSSRAVIAAPSHTYSLNIRMVNQRSPSELL